MHFLNLGNTFALASLFWNVSVATITFEKFPSDVTAGTTHEIKWTSDHDYVSSNTIDQPHIGTHRCLGPEI